MRLLFLLFALICGCQKSYLNDFNKPSPKLKSANAVQKKVAVQLKKEEDLKKFILLQENEKSI